MPPPDRLTFRLERPSERPFDVFKSDHRLVVLEDGQPCGHLDYSLSSGDAPLIHDIEVLPHKRGRGMATALLTELSARHPGGISAIDFTDDGERLRSAWQRRTGERVPSLLFDVGPAIGF